MDPQYLVLSTLLLFLSTTMVPTACISPYTACSEAANKTCFPFPNFTFPFAPSNPKGCGHPNFQVECTPGSAAVLTIGYNKFRVLSLENPAAPTALRLGFVDPIVQLCTIRVNMTLFDMFKWPFYPSNRKRATNASGTPAINVTGCRTALGWLPCRPCDLIEQFLSGNVVNDLSNAEDLIRNGFKVEWNQSDDRFRKCKECVAKNGFCGFDASQPTNPFLCYSHDTAINDPSGACVVFGIASFAISVTYHFFRNRPPAITPDELQDVAVVGGDDPNDDGKMKKLAPKEMDDHFPTFTYAELEIATNSFDKALILGDGGYGCVYRGYLNNGSIVAVKRMMHQTNTLNQFHNEIRIMAKLKHPHLVCLLGYCKADRDLLLVYEYVSNGTLADHLHGARRGNHMSLEARLKIALQTARALEYMHFYVTPTVVHRDIKSSNILLQSDLSVKLADFGLSRDLVGMEGNSHVSTAPQGTLGYVDPEYYRSYRLTQTSDVYSFGVVLMELITGMKALNYNAADKGEINLANLALSMIQAGRLLEIVEPLLLPAEEDNLQRKTIEEMAELGFMCLAPCKDDRPNMKCVSLKLQQIEWCLSSASTTAAKL
ncbi:Wall-associated receptor kinase-like 20 [Nymphaea thermarum]|nr:Wall-associated receptor kinase-like 20 [Nymphaea thermarum]